VDRTVAAPRSAAEAIEILVRGLELVSERLRSAAIIVGRLELLG
jgi:hypothetical protein